MKPREDMKRHEYIKRCEDMPRKDMKRCEDMKPREDMK